MSAPTEVDEWRCKRLLRYLSGHRKFEWKFEVSADFDRFITYCDADWATDQHSRRSTYGGVVTLGRACVLTYARTQSCVALSTAEADHMAMIVAVQTLWQEITGTVIEVHVFSDASAALGAAEHLGLKRFKIWP